MEIIAEKTEKGVTERRFDLMVGGDVVPGIHWLPEGASAPHPTVIIGHGGTQHKRAPNVLGLARMLVRQCGYGVVALDAPGHGDRMTHEQRQAQAELLSRRQGARLAPLSEDRIRSMMGMAIKAESEWKALLHALGTNPDWADGPFGYWGVSMGTALGMPFLAGEPLITAAVLGLGALRKANGAQRAIAARITIPILFLFQWDDELMDRESGLALWDALGSKEKTLHINPGTHVGIPLFERDDVISFYRRHLKT